MVDGISACFELDFGWWMKFSGVEMEACWGVELRGVDLARVLVVGVELNRVRVLLQEFRLVFSWLFRSG